MKTGKSVGLSIRVTPEFKRLLEAAATHERRSLTNMLETALSEYCEKNGIGRGFRPLRAGENENENENQTRDIPLLK